MVRQDQTPVLMLSALKGFLYRKRKKDIQEDRI